MRSALLSAAVVLTAFACSRSAEPPPAASAAQAPLPAPSAAPSTAGAAQIGEPAPAFALPDLDGNKVKLADFKGKTVVLEWFNPGCPFVNLAHTKGSLRDAAARHAKDGVVWLAINSGAPGKQGHGVEANRAGKQRFSLTHPILLDEGGAVGRAYGAERTPHVFVIDRAGTLVYAGAVDNSPDGEGMSPTGPSLVSYVDQTLAELGAGKPVSVSRTEAYGCTVKYGS
jgi:peroxiredoxin